MQYELNDLTKQIRKINTPNSLIQCILQSLIAYYEDKPIPHSPETSKFIQNQNDIGWDHFIRGRISTEIDHIVNNEYKNKKPTPFFTTKRWKQQLCRIISHHHIKIWIKYCDAKHDGCSLTETMKQRIMFLKNKSQKYTFDSITQNWFDIENDQIHQLSKKTGNELDRTCHYNDQNQTQRTTI